MAPLLEVLQHFALALLRRKHRQPSVQPSQAWQQVNSVLPVQLPLQLVDSALQQVSSASF
eukprot:CAMPEP_0197667782 /NCGR_PEP_ID=MMETSP1338-20131121/67440_1 /TAXON_ID=43686 ORGANISM="Pelagodinium beii, Strain RCC1491" /NCGR_SAMPLE_ID=MMETSP1338 /ASSEMBLY_ACC=CAM_ASM_000754 /LENGTH=59 /DNA_ID=CAMNT_0043247103 /DNA_START=260 /DNA_END=439 /DNA_ORIENTATION=-